MGWKSFFEQFVSSIVEPTNVDQINNLISEITIEYAALPYNKDNLHKIPPSDINLTIDDQLFLDVLLMKVRSKTISYAAHKKKSFRKLKRKSLQR